MNLNDVIKNLRNDETLIFDKKLNLAMISTEPPLESPDVDDKITKIYRCEENDLVEIDTNQLIEDIVEAVKDKIDLKDLLKEVLQTQHPESLIQAHDRLKKKAIREKVTTRHGCFSIIIPGDDNEDICELIIRS